MTSTASTTSLLAACAAIARLDRGRSAATGVAADTEVLMLSSYITVVGNITQDIKYVPGEESRRAVVKLASTDRRFDKATKSWSDGVTTYYSVTVWREVADHVIKSVAKGDRIIVAGRFSARPWASVKDGVETSGISLEIDADVIGPDLKWRSVSVDRTARVKPSDQDAPPADEHSEWTTPPGVDPFTGEIDDSPLVSGQGEREDAATVAA